MSKKQPTACPVRKTSIGGQALMEGIMMRGPKTTALAVRNTQGEIVLETFPTEGKKRPAICRLPIIRGVFGFVDSLSCGYKCLMRSAEISGLEELEAEMEREKAEKKAAKKAAKAAKKGVTAEATVEAAEPAAFADTGETAAEAPDTPEAPAAPAAESAKPEPEKKSSSALTTVVMVISMIFAIAIAIGLFFLVFEISSRHLIEIVRIFGNIKLPREICRALSEFFFCQPHLKALTSTMKGLIDCFRRRSQSTL